ncbi:TRM11 family SAM-dependent methyltransferase [Bacillus sp. Marseille-P3661]|uniref:TRM11 family SAM-dependent methyltransferase n=1 Tax=Bacillus sp. Marseille-P3661 TaxID=1936234 RepID=UPI000C82150B|nr:RsmD family RNA methyltransferase [Bacillus sp. Marseille-P3661]
MGNHLSLDQTNYIYTYVCHEEERSLCQLERRRLFGVDTEKNIIQSPLKIDPSRSPFIKERIEIIYKGETIEYLIEKLKNMPIVKAPYKVKVFKHSERNIAYEERRSIERNIGKVIPGLADLYNPEILYAIIMVDGEWVFGSYVESKSIWYLHQKKPHQYSTALSTRVARAIVNIAIPDPHGIQAIDPCCGIGTVLVEALSMGINIVGSDNNPLVMKGARENISFFGLNGKVRLMDVRDVTGQYDVAIIDMPYNLCSVITHEDQLEMIKSARRFSNKMVIITIEEIDSIIHSAGFQIVDRCEVTKGRFSRQILVCE